MVFCNATNLLCAIAAAIAWGVAVPLARRGIRPGPPQARIRRARTARVAVIVAVVLVAARLAAALWLSGYGWLFVADVVAVVLPPAVLPAAVAAAVCLPELTAVARTGEPPRSAARVLVPAGTAAAGALVAGYATLHPPAPPYADDATVGYAVTAGVALMLYCGHRLAARSAQTRPVRPAGERIATASVVGVLLLSALGGGLWYAQHASRLPTRLNLASHGSGGSGGHQHGAGVTSVTELSGPRDATPDRRFTLTAQRARVTLPSGQSVDAWTFNGQTPGPELRMRQGELVEVTLLNRDIADGVSIHWHGLDVPNAEDGVAGVTQDAVPPGGRHVYRFRADQAGTYWYHSHQQTDLELARGLFGALIVEPRDAPPTAGADLTAVVHTYTTMDNHTIATLNGSAAATRHAVAAGTPVRVRVVNADRKPRRFALTGVPYRVAAIDGTELSGPTDLSGLTMQLAAGGRYDLTFTMPPGPVQLHLTGEDDIPGDNTATLLLSTDGQGHPAPAPAAGDVFDPARYGAPAPTPFGRASHFDRHYTLLLDQTLGFYDGAFGQYDTINGALHPNIPPLMVREGELVRVTIANRSFADHPMHLHGHHLLVLSRNGHATSGSPWWTDTLNVGPGETYETAFRADNPGIWMDHCHNTAHARDGMAMHLVYVGVTTPYEIGSASGNTPE